jgi:ABC-2 type transport system ATP-binding protein
MSERRPPGFRPFPAIAATGASDLRRLAIMQTVLAVEEARKSFGETRALDGASVTLGPGEWLALLGPNGAGKTTLVRSIAGRVRLDGGRVSLLGRELDAAVAGDAVRRRLGIVPQEIALYPQLTATENLEAFAALNGLSGKVRRERVAWALGWTGLADRARDRTETFSGGMKRRLNIACGILHEPEVVLLDEPTVGVDPQSRQRIWEMLEELRRGGTSLLLTTHQLGEAQAVADRIVIIDHGRAIAAGTFLELVAETVGSGRRVRFDLEEPLPVAVEGFEQEGDAVVSCSIDEVATELPARLASIGQAGGRVLDVHVEPPTLQAVFLHLTGRELRE